jgi:hypothetical protein
MAVTAQSTPQAATREESGARLLAHDQGKVHAAYFKHTQAGAGDATSTVNLCYLPAGRKRVLGRGGSIDFSAFGASRLLKVGYPAHTKIDGTAVNASDNAFIAALDVSTAGNATFGQAAAGRHLLLDSKEPLLIQATCTGGTIPDLATLEGYILYVME